MTDTGTRRRRPWELTIVVVLAYVQGVLDVAIGILVLLARYDPAFRGDGEAFAVSILGVAIILFGLLVIAVASGIARGDRVARIVLTVAVSVSFVLDVVAIVSEPSSSWGSVASVVLSAAILVICWTGRGARHFRRIPPPTV